LSPVSTVTQIRNGVQTVPVSMGLDVVETRSPAARRGVLAVRALEPRWLLVHREPGGQEWDDPAVPWRGHGPAALQAGMPDRFELPLLTAPRPSPSLSRAERFAAGNVVSPLPRAASAAGRPDATGSASAHVQDRDVSCEGRPDLPMLRMQATLQPFEPGEGGLATFKGRRGYSCEPC
jgi:hypothetical protein